MADNPSSPSSWEFHYIKSNDYRTVLATGVIGGISPNGLINANIFTDRLVIPQRAVYDLADQGLGQEVKEQRVAKGGTVREVFVGLLMDMRTAQVIRDWLNNYISILEQQNNPK